MATNTYVALDSQTLGSAVSSVTFNSIPQGYTDLILEFSYPSSSTSGYQIGLQFNGDTGSNYSATVLYGESSAGSARTTNLTYARTGHAAGTTSFFMTCNIQNYSNSATYKTVIAQNGVVATGVYATAALWRNTAAITSVTVMIDGGTLPAGATFTVYGVAASNPSSTTTPPVAGYSLWLDAADSVTITQSSNLITQWNDKSGNSNNFTASGSFRPTYTDNYLQNGFRTVLFGGSQGMTTPSLPWASSAFTVFSVAKIATASGYPGILETVASGGTGIGVSGATAYYSLFKARIAPNDFSGNATFSTGNADLLTVKSAGMSGGAITATAYKNGTSIGTASFSGGSTASAASIGYDGNAGDFANMNLCEILVYPSQLSDADRTSVENYLKLKWGIA